MERVFTAWGGLGDELPHTLVQGDGPPVFANGTLQPNCERQFWRIVVGSYEEAAAVFNLRRGYEPYRAEGLPAACPNCGALFYPHGSGQCWRCDFIG